MCRTNRILTIGVLAVGLLACGDDGPEATSVRGGGPPGEAPAPAPAKTEEPAPAVVAEKPDEATPAPKEATAEPAAAGEAKGEEPPADPATPATPVAGARIQAPKVPCERGATNSDFPVSMLGEWVDSSAPRRVLNVTPTGISKVPGPEGSAVRASVNLVAGRRVDDHAVIVRCASLATTSMATGADQCRGTVEIERDMLMVSLSGHRACAEELSGVFLRKGSSWTAEAQNSKGKPVFDARSTETAEFLSRSESRCTSGTGKVRVPHAMRGVWFDKMNEDGTPNALLAVTATGIARSSGPSGDGRTASLVAYETNDNPTSLAIACGEIASDQSFELGRFCEGTAGLAGDTLTVDVKGRPACEQSLSGTWNRWHGTEVAARPTRRVEQAAVEAPVVDTGPTFPADAGPCQRIQGSTWRATLQLEAPSYRMDRTDHAMLFTKDTAELHLVSQSNPRASLRSVKFLASRVSDRGERCVYTVREAKKNGPFELFESNPYSVISEIAVKPLADGVQVDVAHGRTVVAPCAGAGCKNERYPPEMLRRMDRSLAHLNGSIWWTPEPDLTPLSPQKTTHGYTAGAAPLGVSAGPECEQLFDSMWMADVKAGHGGADWDKVTVNGLLLRREGIELHSLDADGAKSTAWTRFNGTADSRAGACTYTIHDVARGKPFRGEVSVDSQPWDVVTSITVTRAGGDVRVTMTAESAGKATCEGESCKRARYPRPFAATVDGWVASMGQALFRPVPASMASLDGRPAGFGLSRPPTGTPSHPAAPPTTPPGVGKAPPKPVSRVATGLALGQEWDFAWSPQPADEIVIAITSPVPDEIIRTSTVELRVNVDGFETYKGPHGGNHLRVLLDNEPPRDWFDPNERSMTIDGLAPGLHSLRVFPVTPWNESIKGKNAFARVSFYVRTTKNAPLPIDWTRPTLSYSSPSGTYKGADAHRILLDYFLTNIELSPSGYRIRMQLDDNKPLDLVTWGPVWLENMPAGQHRISMSLINKRGQIVPGPFNQVERSFTVEQ